MQGDRCVVSSPLRMVLTKSHLLVWQTADSAQAGGFQRIGRFLGAMFWSPLSAAAVAAAILIARDSALPVATFFRWPGAPIPSRRARVR